MGEGVKGLKMIQICYIYVQNSPNECNYHVLQMYTKNARKEDEEEAEGEGVFSIQQESDKS